MHPDDLLLIQIAAGIGLLVAVLGVLLALALPRRSAAFTSFVSARRWTLAASPAPWAGDVARGLVGALPIEAGPADNGTVRFRTRAPASMPHGLYVHSQPFRYNAAGPRTPTTPPYDGRYDDPEATSLFGSVPEIVLGDAALDDRFVVQATDEPRVRWLLSRPDVRAALIAAADAGAHCRLLETTVDLDVSPEKLTRPEHCEHHLALLVGLVEALGRR